MSSDNSRPTVIVIGSFMTDVTSYVNRLPKPGETLCGHKLAICCGGKGANQCVTAARLGARCAIIGKLGDDSFGHSYMDSLRKENIDTALVSLTKEALTGVAQILVEDQGQNSIVIVPGANSHLTAADIESAEEVFVGARVVLTVLEIPREASIAALRLAAKHNVLSVFNAAPAVSDLEEEFYRLSDIFCVNETEAEMLTGVAVNSRDQAEIAAKTLLQKGCKKYVLITLGADGALLLRKDQDKSVFVDAPRVKAVDTTGAGDCFLGALAYFLAYEDLDNVEGAVRKACQVASVSVQKSGTQPSFPRREELDQELFAST